MNTPRSLTSEGLLRQSASSPCAKAPERSSFRDLSRHFSSWKTSIESALVKEKGGGSAAPFSCFSGRFDGRSVQPADMERLALEIFFYPELRSLPSEARLLDATERRNLRRDQAGVQADHAELQ